MNLLQSHQVDVILTDFNMPGMNGLELLREIQKDQRYCHIPVVLITTHSYEKVLQDSLALGAKGFLQKPFPPERIREVLDRAIEGTHG